MRASLHPPNRRRKRSIPPADAETSAKAESKPDKSAAKSKAPKRKAPKAAARKAKAARKPRSGQLSAWLQRFQLLTGIIVVISASVLVAWGLRRYLRSSPRFGLKTVLVSGNQRRSAHQIAKRADLRLGKNIFTVDEQSCKTAIEADPWIESAQVDKELPGSVQIKVTERDARLAASIDGQLYLIDSKGNLFKQLDEGDPSDLPIVTGVKAQMVRSDREGVTLRLRRVIDLLADLERERVAKRYPIQEIHVGAEGSLRVVVGLDAVALELGEPPYRLKVAKAKRILGELRYRKVKPDIVFLDNRAHPERVVVRMRADTPRRKQ